MRNICRFQNKMGFGIIQIQRNQQSNFKKRLTTTCAWPIHVSPMLCCIFHSYRAIAGIIFDEHDSNAKERKITYTETQAQAQHTHL